MTEALAGRQHVALAFDRGYLPWAATVVQSHLRHHPAGRPRFHVLHGGDLTGSDTDRLTGMVEQGGGDVQYHLVSEQHLEHLPPVDRFGRVVWMRILLPELLPDLPRVLYLDSDTLVTGSLEELWSTPLADAPLAAVANVVEPAMKPHVAELGIEDPKTFFNSGVLLLNLEVMRAERSFEAVARAVDEHRNHMVWPDQDALNVAFADRWRPLHPRWNAQNSFWAWRGWADQVFGETAAREARAGPAIRHFEGPSLCKPWHYLCPYPQREDYARTLAATPWMGMPLVDRTWTTAAIRRLPRDARIRAYLRLERIRSRSHGRLGG